MADPLAITLHASGEESASGSGGAVDVGPLRAAVVGLFEVTAIPAGETLGVAIESAPSAAGPWTKVWSETRASVGKSKFCAWSTGQFLRATWTLSGAGPVAFAVTGSSHVTYASLDDLDTQGVPSKALEDVSLEVKVRSLLQASADADAALSTQFKVPISAWGEDLRGRVTSRAIYYIFRRRGFDPDNGVDQLIVMDGGLIMGDGQPTAVERWFRDIGRGVVHPSQIEDATPTKREFGARVRSKNQLRGH